MSDLLNDMLNLKILENLCSGIGVEINISSLARTFKKHRNTIKGLVKELIDNKIINKPIYPFIWLFQEYPLLVIARAELPRNEKIDKFLKEDEHIFGAFYVRDEEYNTLLIEFHKDIYSYGEWRNEIVRKNKIPPRDIRYPADTLFFSGKHIIKYQPYSSIKVIEVEYKNCKDVKLNDYKMNELGIQILKKLVMAEGIRTNENLLSQKLKVHRKTIERRISSLLQDNIISKPACRFPRFLVPPDHILVYCLLEIKKSKDKIIQAIKSDSHIPLALEANVGRYNLLLFKVFFNVEDHFKWEENFDNRFPGCIGAMKKLFLSPQMTTSINQQKVSLGIISKRKELLHGKKLMESVRNSKEKN